MRAAPRALTPVFVSRNVEPETYDTAHGEIRGRAHSLERTAFTTDG